MKEQLSFFDTVNAPPAELTKFEQQAFTQEEKVLRHFRKIKKATALQIADALKLHEVSARRSCTNLYNKGYLIKTNEQILERYGKPNYYYTLK